MKLMIVSIYVLINSLFFVVKVINVSQNWPHSIVVEAINVAQNWLAAAGGIISQPTNTIGGDCQRRLPYHCGARDRRRRQPNQKRRRLARLHPRRAVPARLRFERLHARPAPDVSPIRARGAPRALLLADSLQDSRRRQPTRWAPLVDQGRGLARLGPQTQACLSKYCPGMFSL